MSNIKLFRIFSGPATALQRLASDLEMPLQERNERLPGRAQCSGKLKEKPHA